MKTKTLEAFPRSLRLSPKEAAPDLAAKFATWVKLGELPTTAILARFVGSADQTRGSYVNEATGERMGDEVNEMRTLCYLTVTGKRPLWFLILAPAN
jgi:hypothetical protein